MSRLNELRETNRRLILETLREAGGSDRAELARRTGLSRATVSALVAEGLASGVIVEDAAVLPHRPRGRPPARLRVDPSATTVLGVDFGHRHARVAVADLSCDVRAERRLELDVDAGAGAALDAAARMAEEALTAAGADRRRVLAVGLGIPGPIDPITGAVRSSSILPGWAGVRTAEELGRRLDLPVRVENDANLGALGELGHGAARQVDDLVYVKVASGIGAGLILDGALHRGATGVAGEFGHIAVDPLGTLCRCGNRGCLETVASTTAVAGRVAGVHGEVTSAELLELAAAGDRPVLESVAVAGRFVGRAVAALCNALDPGAIVVGGELGAGCPPFLSAIRAELRRSTPMSERVRLTAGVLGDRAELLGAIELALADAAEVA